MGIRGRILTLEMFVKTSLSSFHLHAQVPWAARFKAVQRVIVHSGVMISMVTCSAPQARPSQGQSLLESFSEYLVDISKVRVWCFPTHIALTTHAY